MNLCYLGKPNALKRLNLAANNFQILFKGAPCHCLAQFGSTLLVLDCQSTDTGKLACKPVHDPAGDHVALRRIRPLGMVAERRTEMVEDVCNIIGHFSVVLWAFKEVARNDAGYVDQWVEGACEI